MWMLFLTNVSIKMEMPIYLFQSIQSKSERKITVWFLNQTWLSTCHMSSILLPSGTSKVTKKQWLPQGLHRTIGEMIFFHTFINLYIPHLVPKMI